MEDIQRLNVPVPREVMLKVAEMKKGLRVRRETIVISAIESAYEKFKQKSSKKDKSNG